jgi:hypothetical protein
VAEDQSPFADVKFLGDALSIPELKWRELLFTGALRPDGDAFVRDPARPFPPFEREGLFPEDVRFLAERREGRVVIRRIPSL